MLRIFFFLYSQRLGAIQELGRWRIMSAQVWTNTESLHCVLSYRQTLSLNDQVCFRTFDATPLHPSLFPFDLFLCSANSLSDISFAEVSSPTSKALRVLLSKTMEDSMCFRSWTSHKFQCHCKAGEERLVHRKQQISSINSVPIQWTYGFCVDCGSFLEFKILSLIVRESMPSSIKTKLSRWVLTYNRQTKITLTTYWFSIAALQNCHNYGGLNNTNL